MKFKGTIVLAVLLIPLSAFCGEKRELVLQLLDVMNARENHELVLKTYEEQFSSDPVMNTPEFQKYFREAMSWDGLIEPTIEIYVNSYSAEELQGLISFYKSPIGTAFIKKMPEVNKQSTKLVVQRIQSSMRNLQAE